VTNAFAMFQDCTSYEGLGIGAWNTSSLTDIECMFDRCEKFIGQGIGAWDVSSATNMSYMFCGCVIFSVQINRRITGPPPRPCVVAARRTDSHTGKLRPGHQRLGYVISHDDEGNV